MRAGFYIRRWIRRPAIPPPSYIRRRVSGGFHRGTGVEGGVSGVEGGFLHPPPPSISSGAGSAAQLYRRPATSGGGFRAGFTAAARLRAGFAG